ncbi:MAG: indolepyruvate oxidoreductase subunit beta family protein [Lautropia sp.]
MAADAEPTPTTRPATARPAAAQPATAQPIKIAILAMGGEGGGVLADWIVELGEHNGYLAQTTSVPGVAQRTGATIYYVELFPRAARDAAGREPILALMPMPGDVDVVLASELMEAGRAVQRGLVTADRTTLIASTHRVYSIAEKSAMGNGIVDADTLLAAGTGAARRFIHFDMAATARDHGSVISAVLFGALCASAALPFDRAQFAATIERGGVGVKPSLRAFDAALVQVAAASTPAADASTDPAPADAAPATAASATVTPANAAPANASSANAALASANAPRAAPTAAIARLLARVDAELPAAARALAHDGVARLLDYQDPHYAALYLDRLAALSGAAPASAADDLLLPDAARHLALWMSYEDTIRVADLKTRATRFARVRDEVRAGSQQLLEIDEFMHPRLDEICDTLPAGIGRWLQSSGAPRRLVERIAARGRVIRTTSLRGFLLLYGVAALRPLRRRTLKYAAEQARIERWLALIGEIAPHDRALATEIVRCQRLVKGYGDTHARGLANFTALMEAARALAATGTPDAAAELARLRAAALADESGEALRRARAALDPAGAAGGAAAAGVAAADGGAGAAGADRPIGQATAA